MTAIIRGIRSLMAVTSLLMAARTVRVAAVLS
jgi:hypothetical protein